MNRTDMIYLSQFRSRVGNVLIDWSEIPNLKANPIWWDECAASFTTDGNLLRTEYVGVRTEPTNIACALARLRPLFPVLRLQVPRLCPAPPVPEPPVKSINIWTDGSLDEERSLASSACLTEGNQLTASLKGIPGRTVGYCSGQQQKQVAWSSCDH